MKTDISGKSNGLSGLYWHFKKRCCSILMYLKRRGRRLSLLIKSGRLCRCKQRKKKSVVLDKKSGQPTIVV